MRRLGVVLALAIAGCASGPAKTAPVPRAAASASPRAGVSAAAVTPGEVLLAPAGKSVTFHGQVTVNAAYAAGHAGGQLVTVLGRQVVALDGGTLIHQDGAGIISQDGGSLIHQDGAGIISQDGGSLIHQDGAGAVGSGAGSGGSGAGAVGSGAGTGGSGASGGTGAGLLANGKNQVIAAGNGNVIVPEALVGQDAASLVARDGSTLLGSDGASAIATTAGYRLLADTGAGPDLPAAGMWVSVIDPRTGLMLPLGRDAQGRPVSTVYSDARGAFTVHLPEDLPQNVRVVARAPGVHDPHLALHVLGAVQGADAPVDDPHAAATAYLRFVMADKLAQLFTADPTEVATHLATGGHDDVAPSPVLLAAAEAPLTHMKAVIGQLHAEGMSADRRLGLALLAVDRILADMPLDAITTTFLRPPIVASASQYEGEKSLAYLQAMLEQLASKLGERAAGHGDLAAFCATLPYVRAASARRPGGSWVLDKPGDIDDMLVHAFLTSNDHHVIDAADHIYFDLGMPPETGDRMRAAAETLLTAVATHYMLEASADGTPITQLVDETVLKYGPQLVSASAAAPAPPGPAPSTPPRTAPATVTTVAGSLAGGVKDGPGPQAGFHGPSGLVLDPASTRDTMVFYLADQDNHMIRRLTYTAADQQVLVTTVAGAPAAGLVDGSGDQARFAGPVGLAMDADGKLYVADSLNHAVRRISFEQGVASVTTLAQGAPLDQPLAVAVDGRTLYVGDEHTRRVYSLPLDGGEHPPTAIAGSGELAIDRDARRAIDLHLAPVQGLAVGPDHALYVLEAGNDDLIRVIEAPVGPEAASHLLAGGGDDNLGLFDGYWANAVMGHPRAAAFDAARRRLITVEQLNCMVRSITPEGDVGTLAGSATRDKPTIGHADGVGAAASFWSPSGVAVAPDGSYWVTDQNNNLVRRLVP